MSSPEVGAAFGSRSLNYRQDATAVQQKAQTPDFDEIYRQYGGRVLTMVYRMTLDEETARDLTQDIFVKVYDTLDRFDGRSQVYTWIYRIAVNHVLNHLRYAKRLRWLSLLDEATGEPTREVHASSADPSGTETEAERSERAAIVWRCVEALAPKYRIPLVLYHYEGLSYQEIADAMNLSLSAVEAHIHRARKQLVGALRPWVGQL